ncbi:MAG: vWA domain-containing protein [Candidatus Jordarchaeum sp.]|uniref:vWA domain-containing protein n=1 Tax=Candidatus Jordarchaeum sp. TaxID=2823881 RepID=UPI00404B84D6
MVQVKEKNIVIGMDNSFSMIRFNDVRVSSNVWSPGEESVSKILEKYYVPLSSESVKRLQEMLSVKDKLVKRCAGAVTAAILTFDDMLQNKLGNLFSVFFFNDDVWPDRENKELAIFKTTEEDAPEAIIAMLDYGLNCRGGTNLSGAVERGVELAEMMIDENRVKPVIFVLISDAAPYEKSGDTPEKFLKTVKNLLGEREDIHLNCISIGKNAHHDLFKEAAEITYGKNLALSSPDLGQITKWIKELYVDVAPKPSVKSGLFSRGFTTVKRFNTK